MIISKVKINNYKSIGNERNVFYLDPKITTIIGKNESGKSNVLEAIGHLPYFGKPRANFYNSKNRVENQEISVDLELQFDKQEITKYNVTNSLTKLSFNSESVVTLEGGLSEIITNDTMLKQKIESVIKTIGDKNCWVLANDQEKKQHTKILENLKDSSTIISLNYEKDFNYLKGKVNKNDRSEELTRDLDEIITSLSKYYGLIPRIFYRDKDHQLEYSYEIQTIKEILKQRKDIFYRLMLAADIDDDEMVRAFEERNEGDKQSIREEIENKIDCSIGRKFNEFYTQENIKIKPIFEGNSIKFLVNTDKGKTMLITERSNGLRWYLSLFIEILGNDLVDSSVLFLFDEPGVYLHVNAQKELLNLFEDLTKNGNQIIYTTHSPSMIDGENILNVRVVEKNNSGNTVIYKSGYDQRLSTDSKMETLSPLIKAIGADLKFNLGPQASKLNIITEGISDYMYIKALFNYIEVSEQPYIIPSAGVENINRIVSILLGWGCNFKVLLDYDTAGHKEYKTLVEKLDIALMDHIIFVNGENKPNIQEMNSSPVTIENLLSESDFNQLNSLISESTDSKVLIAKEFYDKANNREINIEQQTIDSFIKIFKKMNII